MNEWFWVWVGLAAVFAVFEVVEGGFYIGPWALGAGSAATLDAAGAGISWQWAAFLGVSSIVFVAVRRIFYR